MGKAGERYVERHSLSASLIDGMIAFENVEDEEEETSEEDEEVETRESQMGK